MPSGRHKERGWVAVGFVVESERIPWARKALCKIKRPAEDSKEVERIERINKGIEDKRP